MARRDDGLQFRLTRRAVMQGASAFSLTGLAAPAFAQDASPGQVVDPLDAWIDEWGRPTANVILNGVGPFRFLVDTGANTSVVTRRVVTAVGAPYTGMVSVNGTTGIAEFPLAHISQLSTGSVRASSIPVAVADDALLSKQDGILGADVFAGKRLTFNIAAKRVSVEPSRRGWLKSAEANMRIRNGMLAEIDGRIGRVACRMMLDTGADKCIVNPPLAEALKRAHPRMLRSDHATVQGVTGQVLAGEYLALPKLKLGNIMVESVEAVAVDAPIFHIWAAARERTMIVGASVLSRVERFTIDYGSRVFDADPMAAIAQAGRNRFA